MFMPSNKMKKITSKMSLHKSLLTIKGQKIMVLKKIMLMKKKTTTLNFNLTFQQKSLVQSVKGDTVPTK